MPVVAQGHHHSPEHVIPDAHHGSSDVEGLRTRTCAPTLFSSPTLRPHSGAEKCLSAGTLDGREGVDRSDSGSPALSASAARLSIREGTDAEGSTGAMCSPTDGRPRSGSPEAAAAATTPRDSLLHLLTQQQAQIGSLQAALEVATRPLVGGGGGGGGKGVAAAVGSSAQELLRHLGDSRAAMADLRGGGTGLVRLDEAIAGARGRAEGLMSTCSGPAVVAASATPRTSAAAPTLPAKVEPIIMLDVTSLFSCRPPRTAASPAPPPAASSAALAEAQAQLADLQADMVRLQTSLVEQAAALEAERAERAAAQRASEAAQQRLASIGAEFDARERRTAAERARRDSELERLRVLMRFSELKRDSDLLPDVSSRWQEAERARADLASRLAGTMRCLTAVRTVAAEALERLPRGTEAREALGYVALLCEDAVGRPAAPSMAEGRPLAARTARPASAVPLRATQDTEPPRGTSPERRDALPLSHEQLSRVRRALAEARRASAATDDAVMRHVEGGGPPRGLLRETAGGRRATAGPVPRRPSSSAVSTADRLAIGPLRRHRSTAHYRGSMPRMLGNGLGLAASGGSGGEPHASAAMKQAHEADLLAMYDGVRPNGGGGLISQLLPETTLRGPGRGHTSGDTHASSPPPPPRSAVVAAPSSSSPMGRNGGGPQQGMNCREPFAEAVPLMEGAAAAPVLASGAGPPTHRRYTDPTAPAGTLSSSTSRSAPPTAPAPPTAGLAAPTTQRAGQGGADGPEPVPSLTCDAPVVLQRERPAPMPAAPPVEQAAAALPKSHGAQPQPPPPPPPAPVGAPPGGGASSSGAAPAPSTSHSASATTDRSTMFARPAKALSGQLVALYKVINARYCNQRRLATPGPKYNRGFDDQDGHYIVLPGEEILERYTVHETLGKGSFGTVVRCYDEKRREVVALKITRYGSCYRRQARLELDILLKLNSNPNLAHLVVKLLKVFDWQGHLVLVFELLSFNLYQLIKCTRYSGVSLELVRKFAYQLVCTLLQLEQQRPQPIIHCDIKPENILLRNQDRSGIRLIDFGSACYADRCVYKYIQSRYYRCPEVILCLGYSTAIDRWSLGCVLVELHTGLPLFDGRTEAAQLARFESTLGPVPTDMIAASKKAHKFYTQTEGGFVLKEPPLPRRSLESVLGVTTGGPRGSRRGTAGHDEASYREFLDFTVQLLRYHPQNRISCQDALRHPFLAPLYLCDQQQRHARRQQPPPPSSPPPLERSPQPGP